MATETKKTAEELALETSGLMSTAYSAMRAAKQAYDAAGDALNAEFNALRTRLFQAASAAVSEQERQHLTAFALTVVVPFPHSTYERVISYSDLKDAQRELERIGELVAMALDDES